MSPTLWIAIGATALMVAGHLLLFWWFLVKRPGKTSAPHRESEGSGTDPDRR